MSCKKQIQMETNGEIRVSKFKRVCVFCGSSPGKKSSYQDAAIELGNELVYIIIKINDFPLHSVFFSFFFERKKKSYLFFVDGVEMVLTLWYDMLNILIPLYISVGSVSCVYNMFVTL